MKSSTLSACNRSASTVDQKAPDDAHDIDTNMSPAVITRAKYMEVFCCAETTNKCASIHRGS